MWIFSICAQHALSSSSHGRFVHWTRRWTYQGIKSFSWCRWGFGDPCFRFTLPKHVYNVYSKTDMGWISEYTHSKCHFEKSQDLRFADLFCDWIILLSCCTFWLWHRRHIYYINKWTCLVDHFWCVWDLTFLRCCWNFPTFQRSGSVKSNV